MTHVKKWHGKKPSISCIRKFGCVSWEHILDDCKIKLDTKSHACIMMGYSEESKSYGLFDIFKKQIIIKCNVIFDDNTSSIGFFKSSSSSSYSDPFGIVEDTRSTIPFMGIFSISLNSVLESTCGQSTSTNIITSHNRFYEGNGTSLTPHLP